MCSFKKVWVVFCYALALVYMGLGPAIYGQDHKANIKPETTENLPHLSFGKGPFAKEDKSSRFSVLGEQTVIIFGLMGVSMALLRQLPADQTQWSEGDEESGNYYESWKKHVASGPVWDQDLRFFNAYSHIHVGASYQVMCLQNGLSQKECFIYANVMSLLWEYGPEAIKEIPSWQDILMTGPVGSKVGDIFYLWSQSIDQNHGKVFNSKVVGTILKFALDPIGTIVRGVQSLYSKGEEDQLALQIFPAYSSSLDKGSKEEGAKLKLQWHLSMALSL